MMTFLKNYYLPILILMLFLGLALFKRQNQELPVAIEENPGASSANTNVTPASSALSPAIESKDPISSEAQTPAHVSSADDAHNENSSLHSPLCPNEQYLILPANYLRLFYKYPTATITVPENYASCFTTGPSQITFFNYNAIHAFPWNPLVRMTANIERLKKYNSYKTAKDEILLSEDAAKKDIYINQFTLIEKIFSQNMNQNWIILKISNAKIESKPMYWPKAPTEHSRVKFITAKIFKTLDLKQPPYKILDVRKKGQRTKNPFPFQSETKSLQLAGSHEKIVDPSRLPKGFKCAFDHDDPILLIGKDTYDHAPYNIASALSLAGYKNLSILEGGAAAIASNFPASELPATVGDKIDADELREKIGDEKDNLLLVDCRNPASSKGTIRNALRIKMLTTKEEKGDDSYSIDVSEITNYISTHPNLKSIVYFGSTALDGKVQTTAQLIKTSLPIYQLDGGYQAWGFKSTYVWEKSTSEQQVIPHFKRVKSPPPHRIARKATGPQKVIIKASEPTLVPPERRSNTK